MIVTDYNYVGSERRRSVVSLRRRTTDHEVACVCEVCVVRVQCRCGVVWCGAPVLYPSRRRHTISILDAACYASRSYGCCCCCCWRQCSKSHQRLRWCSM